MADPEDFVLFALILLFLLAMWVRDDSTGGDDRFRDQSGRFRSRF